MSGWVVDPNGNEPELCVGRYYYLQAGVQYLLCMEQPYNDEPHPYTVKVMDVPLVQVGHTETVAELAYNDVVVWEFIPEVSGIYFVESQNTPTDYQFQIWVWREEQDMWDTYNGGKRQVAMNAGQSYYIAFRKQVAGDPLTDVVLSINAAEEIQLSTDYTVDYDANDGHVYYGFTPAESGFYAFTNNYGVNVSQNGNRVNQVSNYNYGEHNMCLVYLESGVTYTLDFYCY